MKNKHDITKSMLKTIRLTESDDNLMTHNNDETNRKDDSDKNNTPEESFRKFIVNGALVQLSGIDASELEFTENEKEALKSSMDGFISNITDIVEFKILNISSSNIEWVGELTQDNVEWIYSLDDQSGCYISGKMIKLTDETVDTINKLRKNYKEWSSIWGKILSERKFDRRKKMSNKDKENL